MANIFLLFKRPNPTSVIRKVGNEFSAMALDTTSKEGFTATAEVTKHPVEAGADISDHIVLKPSTLSISGIVTETPLGDFPSSLLRTAGAVVGQTIGSKVGSSLGRFGQAGGLLGALGGGAVAKTLSGAIFGSKDKVLGSLASELKKIRDARQTVTIQTGLQIYTSYALTSFTVSRDDKTGGSIRVDLAFEEVIVAESRLTAIAIPKVKGAINKANQGTQSKGDLDSDQNKKSSSILKKLFGGTS